MHVDGHCYCGEIRFEADADPATALVCHCTDCQELTGSAYRAVITAKNFKLLSGTPKLWIKTAESGRQRAHAFCSGCGSPVYSCATDGSLETVSLRIGTLTQRRELEPQKQIWVQSSLPWALDLLGLAWHEKQ